MNKLLSKSSLVDLINKDTKLPPKDVKKILTSILDNIQLTLALNGGVNIRGFGKFESQFRKGRYFQSFQDNKRVKSQDQNIAVFKPSSNLKKQCAALESVDFRKKSRREFIFELEIFDRKNQKLGELGDITPKGLMIVTQKQLKVKENYQLTLKFPELIVGYSDWRFQAKCIWSRKSKLDDTYDNGFKIKNIVRTDQVIIDELLREYAV